MIATIGAFDGFHRGHQLLLKRALTRAGESRSEWGVITFESHPDMLLDRGEGFKSLFDINEQMLLEKFFSIGTVHRIKFTPRISKMSPDEFLDYIWEMFDVSGIVVGEDFRFGQNRRGTLRYLTETCGVRGWSIDVIPMKKAANGVPISSTVIRAAAASGSLRLAWELLGYPFFYKSVVVSGRRRGTPLGFPTANIKLNKRKINPKYGVYAVLAFCGGAWRPGAANIGLNPTFGDIDEPSLEVNLLNYSGDLYGKEITVFMLDRIRDEIRFETAEELKAQIAKDKEIIQNISTKELRSNRELWEQFSALLHANLKSGA
jgi:riboflavin kinase/FMN adenylyltransferase